MLVVCVWLVCGGVLASGAAAAAAAAADACCEQQDLRLDISFSLRHCDIGPSVITLSVTVINMRIAFV